MIRLFLCTFILCSLFSLTAQNVITYPLPVKTSIRGLAISADNTIWISGSNGYTGHSVDSGKTWTMQQVSGFENAELRDIHIMQDGSILVMSSTQPAAILHSQDTGRTWTTLWRRDAEAWFLDAMDFIGDEGICIADPIQNYFMLLHLHDNGKIIEIDSVLAPMDSLAAFAASGSSIAWLDKKTAVFATGGKAAALCIGRPGRHAWQFHTSMPFMHGTPSSGIFSIGVIDKNELMLGGGDYTGVADNFNIAYVRFSGMKKMYGTTKMPLDPCLPYISCICATKTMSYCCGTAGVCTWENETGKCTMVNTQGFNVCTMNKEKSTLFLAGNAVFGVMDIAGSDSK